MYSLAEDIRGR